MRIFLIGCVEFSHFSLQKLLSMQNENLKIVGIVTKEKSAFNSDFYDLKQDVLNIPCLYVKDINDEKSIEFIKACEPDLPQNRARHPIIWALFLGLKESGVSFFVMNKGADTGRILTQKKVKITQKDNAKTLYEKITKTALKELEKFASKLCKKSLKNKDFRSILHEISRPQSKGNAWRKRDF